ACFEAAMRIFSPVLGLRPSEAAREATENVPKPTRRTSPPPLNAPVIDSNTASTALLAADFDRSALPATESINSFLFTCCPLSESTEDRVRFGAEFRAASEAGQRAAPAEPPFFPIVTGRCRPPRPAVPGGRRRAR